jgi:hypothetical protein
MPVRGIKAAGEIIISRPAHRSAQLLEVLLVAERRVLVEPLRREQLGRRAFSFLSVLKNNSGSNERLRRLGQRDHAEAKGHAQLHRALEELDFLDGKLHFSSIASRIPLM